MKAHRKDWLRRLEWEDRVAVALLALLALGLALVTLGGRCLACGLAASEASGLLGTLAQSLSAIFAIAFSLTLVAVQLAAAAYTPRILPLHTWSLYFGGLFVAYLVTIGYLFLAAGHAIPGLSTRTQVDVGLALSLFSLGYLAPFTTHSVRLLLPANIVRALLRRVEKEDFGPDEDPLHQLQPIEDLVVKAMQADDHQTAREGLSLLVGRYLELGRAFDAGSQEGRLEALLVTIPFVDFLERVARFCAQGRDLEMMEEVLAQLQRLSEPLAQRGLGQAGAHVDDALGRIEFRAQEWYEQGKSGVEMAAIERRVAELRAALAGIMR